MWWAPQAPQASVQGQVRLLVPRTTPGRRVRSREGDRVMSRTYRCVDCGARNPRLKTRCPETGDVHGLPRRESQEDPLQDAFWLDEPGEAASATLRRRA